jgi:predicted heme/steroid binding protein
MQTVALKIDYAILQYLMFITIIIVVSLLAYITMENETKKKFNDLAFMIKADRCAAWVLLIVILLYGITGYGMTKGLIDYKLAADLHLGWLGAIGLLAFVVHAGWAIHLAFMRWRVWNIFSKILLTSFFLFVALFFCYLQFFFQLPKTVVKNNSSDTAVSTVKNVAATSSNSTAATETITTKTVFTAETLSQYDGLNGQPAYAAVDGIVYDLSSIFINGQHYGWTAGQDVSQEFHNQHYNAILKGFKVVGTYQAN